MAVQTSDIESWSVSSVLNRDTKQYGKKFLFDRHDDTCWNSDQGEKQHVTIKLKKPTTLRSIEMQFQGGFSCKQCDIELNGNFFVSVYPEDSNNAQTFLLEPQETISPTTTVKLTFTNLTDLFGRVILYDLKFFAVEGGD